MPDCFGRLSDKIAAEVIRRLTQDNVVTAAKSRQSYRWYAEKPATGLRVGIVDVSRA